MKLRVVTSQTLPISASDKNIRDAKENWDKFLPVASPAPAVPAFHFASPDLTDPKKITGNNHIISDFHETQNQALEIVTAIEAFLPVASPAPTLPIFDFVSPDLTDTTKISGNNNDISDFKTAQDEAISTLMGVASALGITLSNDTTIDEIFAELYAQHDMLLIQKIEKDEIFRKLFDPDYIDQRSETDSNPHHAESALLRKLAKEYRKYIEKREIDILEEEIYQEELRAYNDALYEKAIAKKKRLANKKKLQLQVKGAFLSLMFGGDDQDIDVPVMVPLAPQLPAFNVIPPTPVRKVEAIAPIAPIKWSNASFKPIRPNMDAFNHDLRDFSEHIYAGIYRAWIDQNVIIHRRSRNRGPPTLKLVTSN